jgi:hypothetical protein
VSKLLPKAMGGRSLLEGKTLSLAGHTFSPLYNETHHTTRYSYATNREGKEDLSVIGKAACSWISAASMCLPAAHPFVCCFLGVVQ